MKLRRLRAHSLPLILPERLEVINFDVRIHPGHAFFAAVLAAGLVLGSTVHSVQHGLQSMGARAQASACANGDSGSSHVDMHITAVSVDDGICVLCHVSKDPPPPMAVEGYRADDAGSAIGSAVERVASIGMGPTCGRSPPARV